MTKKIASTPEAWDERQLGADEQFAAVAGAEHEGAVDEALGLKLISIRLPETLIEDFRNIATIRGGTMGYQTLMRQVLKRFASSELKLIAREMAEQVQRNKAEEQGALRTPQKKAA